MKVIEGFGETQPDNYSHFYRNTFTVQPLFKVFVMLTKKMADYNQLQPIEFIGGYLMRMHR